MSAHFFHDLGQKQLIAPYARATAVCDRGLAEAHEVVRPEAEADICPDCLSWSRRNRYQNVRCAVEMSAAELRPGLREDESQADAGKRL